MVMRKYLFLAFALMNLGLFKAIDADVQGIDLKLETFIQSVNELHGQALLDGEVLIVQGDQVLCHLINSDIKTYHTPQFMIGSVSKQFTAVALLKALYQDTVGIDEEARINGVKERLQLPISVYLPKDSAIWSGNMPLWAEHVTLHQLLSHTSGVANYTETEECDWENEYGKTFWELPHTSDDMIKLIAKKELLFPSGTKFSYSNTGYVILADVIEALTKKNISKYLQEELFDPIEMASTGNPEQGRREELIKLDRYTRLVPQWNFDVKGSQKEIYPSKRSADMSYGKGAGGIISTANDLLKWNQALHKECSVIPRSLYESLVFAHAKQDHVGVGYGIGIGESRLGKVYMHSGSISTYRTFLVYFPECDLSMIVLCHIAYESNQLESEYEKILQQLKETIPDEKQREAEADKILHETFPATRGFDKIGEFWSQLISNFAL